MNEEVQSRALLFNYYYNKLLSITLLLADVLLTFKVNVSCILNPETSRRIAAINLALPGAVLKGFANFLNAFLYSLSLFLLFSFITPNEELLFPSSQGLILANWNLLFY